MQGTLIGNYRVVRQLAEGGMGAVYIGRHETLGRPVAMKVLLPEMSCNADMVQRFFNEAQAATAIHNPGIVQVFDFGTTPDGRAFIVMELLEGQTLTARLKQRKLDAVECCRIGRQIANVLQAAHERGITHRDLKPDNLFLVPDAEVIGGERVKVLDFGIAKLASELHAVGVRTAIDVVMGTPSYMSPEQCRGAVSAEPRSDIYSLGCILFEMTCGRPPFIARGLGEIIGAHLYNPPPHPQSLAPGIPPALAQLIVHLLAKQPSERPQTMAAVSQSIDGILRALSEPARRAPAPLRELASTLPLGHAGMAPFAPDPKQASGPVPAPTPAHARETVALPVPPGLLASGYAPMPAPIPQPTPISTTISGSAGASVTPPRPRSRRLPLVIGGLAFAAVSTALVIVLAVQVSPSQEPEIPVEAAAGHQDAAATEDAAVAPPRAPQPRMLATDAAVTAPLVKAADLEAKCRGYQSDRKWTELEQCADKLKPLDPKRAAELENQAVEEARAAPHVAAAEAALRDKNLKRARTELEQVWPESADYSSLKRKYELAEAQAITDLAARLESVKDSDCDEYNALLANERASKPAHVTVEAARRAPCSPRVCIADAFADKGQEQLAAGQLAASLASYEAAYNCRPAPEWAEKAFIIACNLTSLPKAKLSWKRLPAAMKTRDVGICVRNRITEDMLNAP